MADNQSRKTTTDRGTDPAQLPDFPDSVSTLVESTVTSTEAADRYSVDALFEALSHPGRRYILTYLLQSDGFVSISELVDYVTTRTDASMTDSEFQRRVTIELTDTHLPALDAAGFIRYNIERQIVVPTEITPQVQPYLTLALAQQRLATELANNSS